MVNKNCSKEFCKMKNMKERSLVAYYLFSFLTLGIYALVFWGKYTKDVNDLCEGDGKKTMKFKYVVLLSIITVGIFGLVWRCKLANRLQENAERYDLKFSEGGALVVIFSIFGLVLGDFILIKNFNKMAKAYNDYNGLADPDADKKIYFFADED
jgi:NADH:ubiquinone oxidoreductase subunit 5 (subunit L)/multisubunit Na+/H+ antiporter MnhA subunit